MYSEAVEGACMAVCNFILKSKRNFKKAMDSGRHRDGQILNKASIVKHYLQNLDDGYMGVLCKTISTFQYVKHFSSEILERKRHECKSTEGKLKDFQCSLFISAFIHNKCEF